MKAQLFATCSLVFISLTGCISTPEKGALLTNGHFAQIQSVDGQLELEYWHGHAVVVDGKIQALLPLDAKPHFEETVDLQDGYVYPGFIDAHMHYLGYGWSLNQIDLNGAGSWEECVDITREFIAQHPDLPVYRGRGWDQNLWDDTTFPTLALLNDLTDKPIVLRRVDGHALIANRVAMTQSNIQAQEVPGGQVIVDAQGQPTGVLIDMAMGLLHVADYTREENIAALLAADSACLAEGITGVHDAGLSTEAIFLIDSLQDAGAIHVPVYAMVSESPQAIDYWMQHGPITKDKLIVRSFKFYSDGALGSRGALLRQPYSDRPGQYGLNLTDMDYMARAADALAAHGWQMNTHAIGDSANHMMLELYGRTLQSYPEMDHRWRIEHAQVVSSEDHELFTRYGILPSVQPTHATSDMDWAGLRLGPSRTGDAYSYHDLRQVANGHMPLGTDCPVERANPMRTLFAAVTRRSPEDGHPEGGFRPDQSLSLAECLDGMTYQAAYAAHMEEHTGRIDTGFWANFTIFEGDLNNLPVDQWMDTQASQVWIHGQNLTQSQAQ